MANDRIMAAIKQVEQASTVTDVTTALSPIFDNQSRARPDQSV
jgi:hypothetical protein